MASKKHRKKQLAPPSDISVQTDVARPAWSERSLAVGFRIVFIVFCLWFLGIVNRDYLFVVQEYNLFLESRDFFLSYAGHVGGLLQYGARFLTQFFLVPFFGAALLTAILLLVQTLAARQFRLHGSWGVLSYILPLLLVRLFTMPEYRVFDVVVYLDDLYGCVLGTLAALVFVGIYAGISHPFGRLAFAAIGSVVFFGTVGVFGLLGMLLCVIREFRFPRTRHRTLRQMLLVLCVFLVPLLYYRLFVPAPLSRLFFIGIPGSLGWGNLHSVFVLLLLIPVFLALFDGVRGIQLSPDDQSTGRKVSTSAVTFSAIMFAAMIGIIVCASHANAEFLATVKMCRLLKQRDWEGILRVRLDTPEAMRPIVWMRNLALFKLGRLGDEAFSFPQGFGRRIPIEKFEDAGVFGNVVLYEFGFVNAAFKATHNQYVSRGANRNGLETFVLCCLVNGENERAAKYLRLMRQAPVLKRLANSWESTETIGPELETIRRLIPTEDRFERPFATLDLLILDGFSDRDFNASPPELRDMFLFTMLIRKDLKNFRHAFDSVERTESFRVPKHFQEAILLGSTDLPSDIEKYQLSPEIVSRFREFEAFRKASVFRTSSYESFYRKFGDTYWYYHAVQKSSALPTAATIYSDSNFSFLRAPKN